MPHPSTLFDDVDPARPERRSGQVVSAILGGSVASFVFAFLLVLAVVGLVAAALVWLVWAAIQVG